ncbi:MAG TPA: YafY family protein [Streptosporangiaceae bacterium]|nr:YafY family protein [Streptosporangiaceae bacterium]
MASTSSRILQLLSLLQTHRYWPGGELAARLGVSPRTLRRDVDRLRDIGYPVRAQRGVEGGYQLAAGAALPPLVVDDEEAVALTVGLRAGALGAIEGIEEASVRALAKVVPVMPPELRRRVEALSSMTMPGRWGAAPVRVTSEVLTSMALACRDTERARFTYTAADGAAATRHVEPHRLVSLGQRWYLVCYDLDRQDWRTFRMDRADSVQSTGVRFRPRQLPGGNAVAFVRAGIDSVRPGYDVEVVIEAPAAAVRDRIGQWSTVEDEGERCRIRMSVDILDWAVMAVGLTGAEFRVVSPPELRDLIGDWAGRFSRATQG